MESAAAMRELSELLAAIGRRPRTGFEAEDASRTGPVVDDDLLAEGVGHLLCDGASRDVRTAARRDGNDHADRLRGIGVSPPRHAGEDRKQDERGSGTQGDLR